MKRPLGIVTGIYGCVVFFLVFRLIRLDVFRQAPELKMNVASRNPQSYRALNDVTINKQINYEINVNKLNESIRKGTGTYKLTSPSGTRKDAVSWSQYGQDLFIDKFLEQKRDGFFVEIGGYDGETFSNTLFLETKRGWSGLLVEANPYVYDLMVKRDRRCFMLNACISNSTDKMTFIIGGALTSAKNLTSKNHKQRIDRGAKKYANYHTWQHAKENVDVKCYSLQSILKTLDQTRIDYFSLDVEGAEMFILNSIDWKILDIDVFTIETDQHRQEILNFMKAHGYKWIRTLLGDDIFRKIR